jgi:glycosyltransferase involved in cell wall biosynthesis
VLPREIILINDASSDNTLNILYDIRALHKKCDIRIINLSKNRGPASARNVAWNKAKGNFIAFLDADDSWHKDKIKIQYHWMLKNPEVDMTCHITKMREKIEIDKDINKKNMSILKINFLGMLFKNSVSTTTVMLKTCLTSRFPEKKYYAEDYHLWLELLTTDCKLVLIDCPLAMNYKQFASSNLSSNFIKMEFGEQEIYKKNLLEGNISIFMYLAASSFSWIKFVRRLIIKKVFH